MFLKEKTITFSQCVLVFDIVCVEIHDPASVDFLLIGNNMIYITFD